MISVAMTSYNGEKYIREQLNSIFKQTVLPDEVIIVDDCSKDDTVKILKEYRGKEQILKIYESSENLGFVRSFYKAISLCSGDYIFLCDQDDIWLPSKIEKMTSIIRENQNIKVLASSFSFIDLEGNPMIFQHSIFRSNNNQLARIVRPHSIEKINLEDIIYHNFCQGCAVVIRKDIQQEYLKIGSMDIYHDYFINLIAAYREGLYFYNEVLFKYRLHSNNTIGLNKQIPLNVKQEIEYRTSSSKKSLEIMSILCSIYPDIKTKFVNYIKMETFLKKHKEYMENKKTIPLLLQNFNPLYFKLFTFKGRIADLLSVLK